MITTNEHGEPTIKTESFEVSLVRYSDPERKGLARTAAVYLGKPDIDNTRRPLNIMKKGDTLAIFRGEHARFHFKTSKIVLDHLVRYSTADMVAVGGLRANEATEFIPPAEDDDPIYEKWGKEHLRHYNMLVNGIEPDTQDPIKKKRLQAARSIAPMSVKMNYTIQFNFTTLIEAVFPQRIWTPGAQQDTKEVVQAMYELVRQQDQDLWDTVYEFYGHQAQAWKKAYVSIRKKDPELFERILEEHGQMKSMWD